MEISACSADGPPIFQGKGGGKIAEAFLIWPYTNLSPNPIRFPSCIHHLNLVHDFGIKLRKLRKESFI